jgi:hypothetical protein
MNSVLYRQYQRPDSTIKYYQVVASCPLRVEFLELVHFFRMSGHFSVEKRSEKLMRYACWQNYRRDGATNFMHCVRVADLDIHKENKNSYSSPSAAR